MIDTNFETEQELDPTNPEHRKQVRDALIAYVNRLSSSEIVDLLLEMQK